MTPELPPLGPATLPEMPTAESAPPPRWLLRDLGLFIGLGALAFFLAYVTMRAAVLALAASGGGRAPALGSDESTLASIIFMAVLYVFLFAAIYGLVALRGRLPFWPAMKWRRVSLAKGLAYFVAGLVLAIAVQLALTVFPDQSKFPLQQLFSSPAVAYALGGFAVVLAPFMEELVFRGLLFAIFEDQVGLRFSIVTTAVLFTAMHIPEYLGAWNHIFLLLIVGLVFSFVRGLTGSLVPSVLLHTAYNFCQVVLLFIATDHFRNLQGVFLH
jgi:membrane protease YdiL (CAAX protease family)